VQVSARVLKGSSEGRNLIRELDQGLSVRITRAVLDPAVSLPYLDCHIDVPCVLACVSDDEYDFCCTVALANMREPLKLPKPAIWLEGRLRDARPASRGGSAGAPIEAALPSSDGSTGGDGALPLDLEDDERVSAQLRATLHFGRVELECTNEHAGREPTRLALLHASKLFISYVSNGPGHMDVRICLPRLEAHDLREVRAAESSLVLSSSTHVCQVEGALDDAGPSLLTVAYSFSAVHGQDIVLRLQRPTVVAEVEFLLAALKFVVPGLALGAEPTPFSERDVQCALPTSPCGRPPAMCSRHLLTE
jgi:hypothetical protein